MIPHRDRGASRHAVPDHIPSWVLHGHQAEAREQVEWSLLVSDIDSRARHDRTSDWLGPSRRWTAFLLAITVTVGLSAVIVPVLLGAAFPVLMASALVSVLAALATMSVLQLRARTRRRQMSLHPSSP